MWRSSSVNHTPYYEPCLPSQPHIVIQPLGGVSRPDLEPPGAARPERDRKLGETPVGKRARRGDGTRAARQGFILHAALVGSHAPVGPTGGCGDEVHIRAPWPERRVGPQQSAARHYIDALDVLYEDHEVRHAHRAQRRPSLARRGYEARHGCRRANRREVQLGTLAVGAAATLV